MCTRWRRPGAASTCEADVGALTWRKVTVHRELPGRAMPSAATPLHLAALAGLGVEARDAVVANPLWTAPAAPVRGRFAVIRVGTCAWSDHTDFYPPGLPKPGQITHYARFFPLVEVDSSFYRPPSARNCALWTERTPPDFRFHVKAYRALTWHDREAIPDAPELAALARQFAEAVEPMRAAGKLTALHFQFPPWFQARSAEREYLAALREALPDHLMAIEFRHRSWFRDGETTADTLEILRRAAFVHTVVDQPQIGSGSVPLVPAVTNPDLAILRLHGRNAATWYRHTATSGERFKYRYAPDELRGFVQPVRSLAAEAGDVHVLTNNNFEDSAVRNAAELAGLLQLGYPDPWAAPAAAGG